MERYQSAVWAAAVLLLGLTGTGQVLAAQDAAPKAEASKAEASKTETPSFDFDELDKNHDGFISRSEVPKEMNDLRSHFDQYDQNHDHRLSRGEFMAAVAALDAKACTEDQKMATAKCNLGTADNGDAHRQSFQNIPFRNAAPPPGAAPAPRGR